ncbi:unnamed protein product [Merluccius merluccius]
MALHPCRQTTRLSKFLLDVRPALLMETTELRWICSVSLMDDQRADGRESLEAVQRSSHVSILTYESGESRCRSRGILNSPCRKLERVQTRVQTPQ